MKITKLVTNMFKNSFSKEWYETYWAIDLHGTIVKPSYVKGCETEDYYPYAKLTLQLLSERKDIKLILWTCSDEDEIIKYLSKFKDDNIIFDSINENPNISSRNGNFGSYDKKFYFNILIDDKAGFNPNKDWQRLYFYLLDCKVGNYLPNPKWTTKY